MPYTPSIQITGHLLASAQYNSDFIMRSGVFDPSRASLPGSKEHNIPIHTLLHSDNYYPQLGQRYVNHSQGHVHNTKNIYHVALSQDSQYFALPGQRYTRDGRLTKHNDILTHAATGEPILNTNGSPINLGRTNNFTISNEGHIQDLAGRTIDTIGVFTFDDMPRIDATQDHVFFTDQSKISVESPKMLHQSLENSTMSSFQSLSKAKDATQTSSMAASLLVKFFHTLSTVTGSYLNAFRD